MNVRIAHSEGLLPTHLKWDHWAFLSREALTHIDHKSLQGVDIRYRYDELRLSRINWCWSLCSRTKGITSLARGYFNVYHDYEIWFKRHIAWITGSIAYVALVLTAMQVGLRTDRLRTNRAFQDASYAFTIFAIVAPLEILFGVGLGLVFMVLFNWSYTNKKRKKEPSYWWTSRLARLGSIRQKGLLTQAC